MKIINRTLMRQHFTEVITELLGYLAT